MQKILTKQKWLFLNSLMLAALAVVILLFSFIGVPMIAPSVLWGGDDLIREIFFSVRVPRVLLAAFVGASLSASGVAFQSLLRNPLADPYILGVAGGAALGAVLSVALGLPAYLTPIMAFGSAFVSLLLIYRLARVRGTLPVHTLLLTGVIFNALSFALILLIHALAQQGQMHQILYLLMGSLEATSLGSVLGVGLLAFLGFLIVLSCAPKMNLISLGEAPAQQLGLNVGAYRTRLFIGASLMVGASVSLAGLIGFVGLFVPHMMRLIFGMDHRLLLTTSALAGGIFLILCDFLARYLLAFDALQTQLPVGVITALLGGPLFFYLLKKSSYSGGLS